MLFAIVMLLLLVAADVVLVQISIRLLCRQTANLSLDASFRAAFLIFFIGGILCDALSDPPYPFLHICVCQVIVAAVFFTQLQERDSVPSLMHRIRAAAPAAGLYLVIKLTIWATIDKRWPWQ